MTTMKTCILLYLCAEAAYAVRIKIASKETDFESAKVNTTSDVAASGQMLRGRYRLDKYLYRHSRAIPGKSFPNISSSRRKVSSSTAEHLGTGSFGDVWQAFDTDLNKMVAVKIFYQGSKYMTWLNANLRGKAELRDSARECTLIKKILDNRQKYPIGAARICECYEEYINDAKGTHNVVFLVQEMCGQNLQKAVIAANKKTNTVDVARARTLTKQMLQGLAFLQMFDPPLIHHDLKPANVCVNDKGQVKIIDWGALVHGTTSDMYKGAAATPLYMPPETKSKITSFTKPWWSYDVYAVGLMHMEMTCPMVEAADWYYQRARSVYTYERVLRRRCPEGKLSRTDLETDVEIIAALANHVPEKRPEPMKFLDDPSMRDVPTPRVEEDEAEQLLIFKVGDEVEYWSTTYSEWMPATIGRVRVDRMYDLLAPSTKSIKSPTNKDWMKIGADPARVRTPEKQLRASVADNFIVRPSRLPDIDLDSLQNGNANAADLSESGVVHLKPEDVELSPIKEKPRAPQVAQDLPQCATLSLKDPSVYEYVSDAGIEVVSFLTCPLREYYTCSFESVTVSCGFNAGKRQYGGTLKGGRYSTEAKVIIPRSAEILGTRCTMETVGTATSIGDKSSERCKSFPKHFTLRGSTR